jgi:hypothetical protein
MKMIDQIRQIVSDVKFQDEVIAFLMDICRVDTTANSDIRLMAENEKRVYEIIRSKLGEFSFENATTIEKRISPLIMDHPATWDRYWSMMLPSPNGPIWQERFLFIR